MVKKRAKARAMAKVVPRKDEGNVDGAHGRAPGGRTGPWQRRGPVPNGTRASGEDGAGAKRNPGEKACERAGGLLPGQKNPRDFQEAWTSTSKRVRWMGHGNTRRGTTTGNVQENDSIVPP